jgi:hypothetical protein
VYSPAIGEALGWWVIEHMMLACMKAMFEKIQFIINVSPYFILAAVMLGSV